MLLRTVCCILGHDFSDPLSTNCRPTQHAARLKTGSEGQGVRLRTAYQACAGLWFFSVELQVPEREQGQMCQDMPCEMHIPNIKIFPRTARYKAPTNTRMLWGLASSRVHGPVDRTEFVRRRGAGDSEKQSSWCKIPWSGSQAYLGHRDPNPNEVEMHPHKRV